MDLELEEEVISRIQICKEGGFTDPHDVPVSAPVSLCEQFGCMHVCIYLQARQETSRQSRTVTSVLMSSSRERVLPSLISPPEGKTLRADQELYNDLIGV